MIALAQITRCNNFQLITLICFQDISPQNPNKLMSAIRYCRKVGLNHNFWRPISWKRFVVDAYKFACVHYTYRGTQGTKYSQI